MIFPFRDLRPIRVVGLLVYWVIVGVGLITALNVLNTRLTSQIAETLLFSAPKLVAAAVLLLCGIWLAQYLARGTLVWAVNEELPAPRRLAAAVRVLVLLIAIAAVADYLNFARHVFLTAFILVLGGVVLTGSLALGLGGREAVKGYLQHRSLREGEETSERSVWNHL